MIDRPSRPEQRSAAQTQNKLTKAALPVRIEQSILVVLPVYNGEFQLDTSVRKVRSFLNNNGFEHARVLIADNASNDKTPVIGSSLATQLTGVEYRRIERKGRGHALKITWLEASEDVLTYMDVDLSTHLECFPRLVYPLITGSYDLAIGSRLSPESRVARSVKREVTSRIYNHLVRFALKLPIKDSQCGFKGITQRAAKALLPEIENDNWFFDTELLILASSRGWRIKEEAVSWTQDERTTVNLVPTISEDLAGIYRMKRTLSIANRECARVRISWRSKP